ncbi:Spy/CpxP family protein refolding chaperone [Streptacidiphilus sp. MAP12-16]|uniref:hypothetical protein n=1 Tax=Streptacidiphilus sp. MAP12-16 TaxID=3156300 RepID=UPI003516D073
MAAKTPEHRVLSARTAALKRHHPEADHSGLERDLRAARLEEHIRATVETWPALTPEQRAKLAVLLANPDMREHGNSGVDSG